MSMNCGKEFLKTGVAITGGDGRPYRTGLLFGGPVLSDQYFVRVVK